MSLFIKSSIVYLTIISLLFLDKTCTGHSEKEYSLLLISFDGFRWDYLSKIEASEIPNFQRMVKSGVSAKEGLKNVFPTNTLPNHWSMVTGLYPESHGVLDNYIKDPDISKPFIPKYIKSDYENDPGYYNAGGEPIWITNQLQKKEGRSGSIMWWGSNDLVKFMYPTLVIPYDDHMSYQKKIDTMIEWFTYENPINLGLIYFAEPDHTAHIYGPNSSNVTKVIKEADAIIGYLLDKLEKSDLLDDLNIIVTSDHGFSEISHEKVIKLSDIINSSNCEYLGNGSFPMSSISIFPKEGHFDEIYSQLKQLSEFHNFTVFKGEDIPERFHYRNNKRVPPILALADPQYSFILDTVTITSGGSHGYDNEVQDMHPFFIAMGPSLKKEFVIDSFLTVDIYPLMCHLLGIHPAPNNGSMKQVSQLLKEGPENSVWTFGTYILVLIVIGSVGGVFTVAACRHHRYLKRRMSPLQATIKYSTPTGSAKASLLFAEDDEDEDDDFDDAKDDKILEIMTSKW